MVEYNVDSLYTSDIQNESDVGDESIGSNSGDSVILSSVTKTETEWGTMSGWELVEDNKFSIASLARNTIQSNYPGKMIDLDGIYVTYETV